MTVEKNDQRMIFLNGVWGASYLGLCARECRLGLAVGGQFRAIDWA